MKKRIEKYKIRHWGDDTNCKSIQELKEALLTKYLNLSVAIHFEKRGIIWVRFITIKNNQVLNSYGDESLFDFQELEDDYND
ncbi:hypothetical protein CRYPA_944 [uncultured Candidatus Thioglobus sp.]|nr:hypothetical protein CRYPA_944 [uncultured Candidatus Thioglobus sp.]